MLGSSVICRLSSLANFTQRRPLVLQNSRYLQRICEAEAVSRILTSHFHCTAIKERARKGTRARKDKKKVKKEVEIKPFLMRLGATKM